MVKEWFAVVMGGMLGVSARHALSGVFSLIGPTWLPIATLAANAIGCLLIGVLAQWSLQQDLAKEWWVVGLRVGLLGGLTTFSSFGLDVVRLWNDGRNAFSISLAASHIVLGLAAVVIGIAIARQ